MATVPDEHADPTPAQRARKAIVESSPHIRAVFVVAFAAGFASVGAQPFTAAAIVLAVLALAFLRR